MARKRCRRLMRATRLFQRLIRGYLTRARLAHTQEMKVKLQKVPGRSEWGSVGVQGRVAMAFSR